MENCGVAPSALPSGPASRGPLDLPKTNWVPGLEFQARSHHQQLRRIAQQRGSWRALRSTVIEITSALLRQRTADMTSQNPRIMKETDMTQRYREFKRTWGTYYVFDNVTGNSVNCTSCEFQKPCRVRAANLSCGHD